MAAKNPDSDVTVEKVVYIGRRLTGDNRIGYWHLPLVDDELTDKATGSYKPYRAGLPVGGIVPSVLEEWHKAGAAGYGLGSALYVPGMDAATVGDRARAFVAAWQALRG